MDKSEDFDKSMVSLDNSLSKSQDKRTISSDKNIAGLNSSLAGIVEKHSSKFCKILKHSLNIKGEEVLIVSDFGKENNLLSSMLGYGYYHAAKSQELKASIVFQSVKKGFMFADDNVTSAIKKLGKNSVIILAVSNKLGKIDENKSFRNFCRAKGHRFISATGLGDIKTNHFDLFLEAMNANYRRMKKKGLAIKKKWDSAEEIRVKTFLGTDITFDVSGMEAVANVGEYHDSGCGGNMPAGEVYIPPKGYYGVKGIVVIDGSIKTESGTLLVNQPVKLIIEEGRVSAMEGNYSYFLEKTFQRYEDRAVFPYRVRHIGELGVGINPGAVLLGSMVMDEKVLGTGHIAVGSNYWFGGSIRTIYHGDQVFKKPVFYVDGKKMDL